MAHQAIGKVITISNEEIESIKAIINVSARLINQKFHERCREAAAAGKNCAEFPPEYFDLSDAHHKLKSFLDKINLN